MIFLEARVRICIVYDCLFPCTIGGAERWYATLARRLVDEGHTVTYVTLRQWDAGAPPDLGAVRVVAVGPRLALYKGERRRIWPPLRFGLGVFAHMLRHGRSYDAVHAASFPFFALLALAFLRPFCGYRIVCDWHEVWSLAYWRAYLGPLGWVGWLVQWFCARARHRAITFSALHQKRLSSLGGPKALIVRGQSEAGADHEPRSAATPPYALYAGRLIPEKRVPLLIDALAIARRSAPDLRLMVIGDGPDLAQVKQRIEAHGLGAHVDLPGFVSAAELEDAMGRALCLVQPSSREGYGKVVVEACARGVPVLVVPAPDNAATELIEQGRNGFVADAPTPEALAAAMLACHRAGPALRETAGDWRRENKQLLSLDHWLPHIIDFYGEV